MKFSRQLTTSLAGYLLKNKVRGRDRFPLVLMLEPLFRCNLRCDGCGRIREFQNILDQTMTVKECLDSVVEAGAPVVSITGGEPLLHPEIEQIVTGVIAGKRFVNLCTNGLLLERALPRFKPSPHLAFVVHLDGLAETHDRFANRPGVFAAAFSAIKSARRSGFQVLINTTIYKQTKLKEIKELLLQLASVPVNGILVTPAFNYEAVDVDSFLSRQQAHAIFQELYSLRRQVPFYNTPLYLEFLRGKLSLECQPWSTPTRNPKGWKMPCYLLTDGHCSSFRELMEKTDWRKYGAESDPRCAECMVHCGFEGSALAAIKRSPSNLWKTLKGVHS
jgi:hopanoid biosynthesis associated radical SAM protein HpnH